MKKTILIRTLLFLTSLLLTTTSCDTKLASPKTFVEKHGALQVRGGKLVDAHGNAVVLRGVSYAWHNHWPRFYNASSVKFVVEEWKATVVRAAMGIELNRNYLVEPEFGITCVTTLVDAAIENGVYVVIDWHSHHIATEAAKDFFAQMATKYKGVPNVIYEIYNEPVDDTWSEVKEYAIAVIGAIRAVDPNAIVLVGTPHWDQDIHLAADDPIREFDNIMYTLHFYAATHQEWLMERGDYAISKGLPLFISECAGMEASGDGPIDHEMWDKWVRWMESNELSWIGWAIADKYETCSMLYPFASSEGGWGDEDLKEWAKIVKRYLFQYNTR